MTPLLAKAISFAQQKHANQKRKSSGLPYITHLAGVATLITVFKKSKNLEALVCAGYLHDTLEDTDTTEEELLKEFGPLICSLVVELTNKSDITRETKLSYLKRKMLDMSNYALTIKLCDRLHNLSDNPTLKTVEETEHLMGYLVNERTLTKTQTMIVNRIDTLLYGKEGLVHGKL